METFLTKSPMFSVGLREKAPLPAPPAPPCRVLSRECRDEIRIFFPRKGQLLAMVSLEVVRQCSWEAHLWPVLSPWVPDPQTTEEAEQRKQKGHPRTGRTIHPPPAQHALGCVSWQFIKEQIEKVRAAVDSSETPDELIARIEQEVEVL